jgi:metal-dependent amidase/aminoacylase/carboxypeptidase family protein
MASIVGAQNVQEQEPTMGSDDFSYMLQVVPGAMCFIANGDGNHRDFGHGAGPCMLHNPSYDFNDALIPLGASYWVRLAETWFAREAPATIDSNSAAQTKVTTNPIQSEYP